MKRQKKKSKNKKTIPLNIKTLGADISAYPFVEIKWCDIEGDAGWSQTKGITRIFSDYILNKDKPTFDTIGNTTIIPTTVIQSIRKIH